MIDTQDSIRYLASAIERSSLRAENDQLRKENEYLQRTKITVIHRHGEATALLAKFCRCWAVRLFCRALRKEAAAHISQR